MSTPALIAYVHSAKLANDVIESVTVNFGQFCHNAAQLLAFYPTIDRAADLTSYGNLSVLNGPDFAPAGSDSGGTVAYSLWRNDRGQFAQYHATRRELIRAAVKRDISLIFLHNGQEWTFAILRGGIGFFQPLTVDILNEAMALSRP